ncbi:unnamed protein product [Miscanthus lutarioriparius]|uniref:HAT C-terminal dimerisation domain-containing protein n=1 Tax=Miscanthus lutarioriparius TaxID=422564 RepID=A0A811Q0L6_9POAL|nr:unnamed protein product [Miscanthus lutarioriparius]
MGYLFSAFHASRDEIVKRFQRKELVKPFLDYIDARCERYSFTTSGVLDVIEKYAGKDFALWSSLTRELRIFRRGEGDFGRPTAKNDRQHMLAAAFNSLFHIDEWWETYDRSAPNLQKLALRVLSQTCSASGCEISWSMFEHVHSKKRNRLEHQRLNDIVFVHCNLRLRQRSKTSTRNYDPISLDEIRKGNEAWVVEDNPPRLNAEELNEFQNELSALSIKCSDDMVLNLDEVEADATDESERRCPAKIMNFMILVWPMNIVKSPKMKIGIHFTYRQSPLFRSQLILGKLSVTELVE